MFLRHVWVAGLLALATCPSPGPRSVSSLPPVGAAAPPAALLDGLEQTADARIDADHAAMVRLSDTIWTHAELAFQEHHSSKLLADTLEKGGFTVRRGVAGLKTSFVAEYGKGRPVIGFLAEYDALPGLSQKAQP